MGDWLARDLFDDLPEGVPPLDPEDDEESNLRSCRSTQLGSDRA
jgi:hypothetical protein